MSPLLSLHSSQEMKLNRQFQTLLLFVRLLLSGVLAWRIYTSTDFSILFSNSTVFGFIATYAALSSISYLLMLFRPTKAIIYYIGVMLDWIFSISLIFLLPDQAGISVLIGILFIVSTLSELKLYTLFFINLSYIAAALLAGWYFNTIIDAGIHNAHLLGFILFLIAYLYYFKNHNLSYLNELKDSLNTSMLQKKHLIDALFYLYPYHQRNQTPITLLMIRLEKNHLKSKKFLPELANLYKSRIRKSDFLIQLDKQHLAILLPDTNNDQASHLVKALKKLKEMHITDKVYISYAVSTLPLDVELALDSILGQMMKALYEAEQQQVDRLIFVSAKQSD